MRPAPRRRRRTDMAEAKPRSRAAMIRPIVLLIVLGTISFFVWRSATRKEGYTGGDVMTTGTIEAVHVDLGFKVSGRLAEGPVAEGGSGQAGPLGGRLGGPDPEVHVGSTG